MAKWTQKDINFLKWNYGNMTAKEIADKLGRSVQAIYVKSFHLGLKKENPTYIKWTPRQLKMLKDFFPIMFNKPLAKWLGVSQRTMIRKARELGLNKYDGFLKERQKEIQQMAGEALRARGNREGTWFKKGVRFNPSGEFKKGHVETPETKAKRVAALKLTLAKRKAAQREQKINQQIIKI